MRVFGDGTGSDPYPDRVDFDRGWRIRRHQSSDLGRATRMKELQCSVPGGLPPRVDRSDIHHHCVKTAPQGSFPNAFDGSQSYVELVNVRIGSRADI